MIVHLLSLLQRIKLSPTAKKVLSYSKESIFYSEESSLLQRRKFSPAAKKVLYCSEESSLLQQRKFSPTAKKVLSDS